METILYGLELIGGVLAIVAFAIVLTVLGEIWMDHH